MATNDPPRPHWPILKVSGDTFEGMGIVIDVSLPPNTMAFCDGKGKLLGEIINIPPREAE